MTTTGLYDLSTFTTLESNKSLFRNEPTRALCVLAHNVPYRLLLVHRRRTVRQAFVLVFDPLPRLCFNTPLAPMREPWQNQRPNS